MCTWYYISKDEGYNRTHRSFVLFFLLGKPALGQHNFEFSSVSSFHGNCGGAGLIFIAHFI